MTTGTRLETNSTTTAATIANVIALALKRWPPGSSDQVPRHLLERVVETGGERAQEASSVIGIAAVVEASAEEQAARVAKLVDQVRQTVTHPEIAWMIRIRFQVVVPSLDPVTAAERPAQRDLETVSVEAAPEIIHLVMKEDRVRRRRVPHAASKACAEDGGFVSQLHLIGARIANAITDAVVRRSHRETRRPAENHRRCPRIDEMAVAERRVAQLRLHGTAQPPERLPIQEDLLRATGAGQTTVRARRE